jgi:hypothetical protein
MPLHRGGQADPDARGEVTRLIDTFRIAAEESVRIDRRGAQPLDISPRARGYRGMWKRVPIGPCSFISPFNFPLNLAAHKIAPALAVGCPFVLKPASRTPARRADHRRGPRRDRPARGRVLHPALPPRRRGPVHDRRSLKLLSFTGSPERRLGPQGEAPARRRSCWSSAATPPASSTRTRRPRRRGRAHGVRRLLPVGPELHRRAAHPRSTRASTSTLARRSSRRDQGARCRRPADEATFIGPMISEAEAKRLDGWVEAAVAPRREAPLRRRREGAMLHRDAARRRAARLKTSLCRGGLRPGRRSCPSSTTSSRARPR